MCEEIKPVTVVEESGSAQSGRALRKYVLDITLRVQQVLKDVPWVGLGATCTGVGAVILYWYFWSIDYVPPDFTNVLALSAAIAVVALAFILMFVIALIAPRWAYQIDTFSPATKSHFTSGQDRIFHWELASLQFLGVGLLLLYIAYQLSVKCIPDASRFGWTGLILASLGAVGWAYAEWRAIQSPSPIWRRVVQGLFFAPWSLLPFLGLYAVLVPGLGVEWWHLSVFVIVWVGVVVGSAFLPGSIPLLGLALMGSFSAPAFLFSFPLLIGQPNFFPTKVAELSGIRSRAPIELIIPKSTCALIQEVLGIEKGSSDLRCNAASEWGSVKAQVLSNLGDRWLIDLEVDAGGHLRITIPSEGVQTVRRIVPKVEASRSCSPKL